MYIIESGLESVWKVCYDHCDIVYMNKSYICIVCVFIYLQNTRYESTTLENNC